MDGLINVGTATGELTINGVNMHTPAWCMLNLLPLWLPNRMRGTNVTIPEAAGTLPQRYRIDESSYSLAMAIGGHQDKDGGWYADPWVGLQANLEWLHVYLLDPPLDSPTVPAELVMPDGNTMSADVQVRGILPGVNIRQQLRATLELLVPHGRFSASGS